MPMYWAFNVRMCTSSYFIHKVLGLKDRSLDPILSHSGTVHTQPVHLVYTDNAIIFTPIFMWIKCPS